MGSKVYPGGPRPDEIGKEVANQMEPQLERLRAHYEGLIRDARAEARRDAEKAQWAAWAAVVVAAVGATVALFAAFLP